MAHLAVSVALLFLACVSAVPAPEPSNPKLTFVKDSALGLGVAEEKSKAHGLVESGKVVETPVEAPVDTGNTVPDVTVLDNVNAGAAFAGGGSIATGLVKNNKFEDNPTKGALPVLGQNMRQNSNVSLA